MDYRIFGNIAMVLLFSQMVLFAFRRILKYGKIKNKSFVAFVRFLRPLHIATGFTLVGVGLTHGVLVLGRLELHTGWVLWIGILLAMLGFILRKTIGSKWVKVHRVVGFVLLGLFLVHRFFPYLL